MSQFQAYIVVAQDLQSDAAEWQIHTGRDALERAEAVLTKWVARDGRWCGQVLKVDNDHVLWMDGPRNMRNKWAS